jgi:hypothetical protein
MFVLSPQDVQSSCHNFVKRIMASKLFMCRPIARPWTWWVQRLPGRVNKRKYLICTQRCFTHILCIYIMQMPRKRLFQDPSSTLLTTNALYNIAQSFLHIYIYIYIFLNELCPTTAVQQRQHVDAVGYRKFFSGLVSIFIFDILQVHSECI